jgi:distribution and morphology protein 31
MSVVCRASTGLPHISAARFSLSSHAVVKRSSRPSGAALDRYATIRKYFRRQDSMPSGASSKRGFVPRHTMCAVGMIVLRCPSREMSATFSRTFHATRLREVDEKREHSQLEEDSHRNSRTEPQSNPQNLDNYSGLFRRLALSLPHLPRPTKDDFLNVTTSFWQRTRIRFKWFTIKSFRKWNADDISAFFTWFLMTQTVWILVGT